MLYSRVVSSGRAVAGSIDSVRFGLLACQGARLLRLRAEPLPSLQQVLAVVGHLVTNGGLENAKWVACLLIGPPRWCAVPCVAVTTFTDHILTEASHTQALAAPLGLVDTWVGPYCGSVVAQR